jgi:hypothetical protein
MKSYKEYIARKMDQYGSKFNPINLANAPQFIPYLENGKRIEVDFGYEKKRGTIGITTGWKPIFLLMLTKRSIGSSYTLQGNEKIVKVIE